MNIETFDDLLQAARRQPQPQRLLFVFVTATLPADATPQQRADFAAGHGGELTPSMCVDKLPAELPDFAALVAESRAAGCPEWPLVFVAALSGHDGQPPSTDDASTPLQRMVESIQAGRLDGLLPFDRHGTPVRLG